MVKKTLLAFLLLFVGLKAEDEIAFDVNIEYQKLVYNLGMGLAEQATIYDQITVQDALINVVQDLPLVEKIIEVFLSSNSEMIENNISSLKDLISYEYEQHYDLAQAVQIWLSAYQDVFTIFNELHEHNVSFEVWCNDIACLDGNIEELEFSEDSDYVVFLQACMLMLKAQEELVYEFNLLEDL